MNWVAGVILTRQTAILILTVYGGGQVSVTSRSAGHLKMKFPAITIPMDWTVHGILILIARVPQNTIVGNIMIKQIVKIQVVNGGKGGVQSQVVLISRQMKPA